MSELRIDLPAGGFARLGQLYMEWLPEYHKVNLTRDPQEGELFWQRLTAAWFREVGVPTEKVLPAREVSERLFSVTDGRYFRVFPDVLPCIVALKSQGLKLAIVSNWDYTLHSIVERLGLKEHFDVVMASLEEGVEKPDPRLFEICLERVGVSSDRAVHVGDDLIDDIEGAMRARIRPILLDRHASHVGHESIKSLTDLMEVVSAWSN
jgi:putative hydrolase of the HAD superfamily